MSDDDGDLYEHRGVTRLGELLFQHRQRPPGRRGFERADAAEWLMWDGYHGTYDEIADALERDCRIVLSALAGGRILAGTQQETFTMLIPGSANYWRSGSRRDTEPRHGPLSAFDTTGLIDVRALADEPYPPKPPPAAWRRAIRRRLSTRGHGNRAR